MRARVGGIKQLVANLIPMVAPYIPEQPIKNDPIIISEKYLQILPGFLDSAVDDYEKLCATSLNALDPADHVSLGLMLANLEFAFIKFHNTLKDEVAREHAEKTEKEKAAQQTRFHKGLKYVAALGLSLIIKKDPASVKSIAPAFVEFKEGVEKFLGDFGVVLNKRTRQTVAPHIESSVLSEAAPIAIAVSEPPIAPTVSLHDEHVAAALSDAPLNISPSLTVDPPPSISVPSSYNEPVDATPPEVDAVASHPEPAALTVDRDVPAALAIPPQSQEEVTIPTPSTADVVNLHPATSQSEIDASLLADNKSTITDVILAYQKSHKNTYGHKRAAELTLKINSATTQIQLSQMMRDFLRDGKTEIDKNRWSIFSSLTRSSGIDKTSLRGMLMDHFVYEKKKQLYRNDYVVDVVASLKKGNFDNDFILKFDGEPQSRVNSPEYTKVVYGRQLS